MAGPIVVSAVELTPATKSLEAKLRRFEEFCKRVFPEALERALWSTYRSRKSQAESEISALLRDPRLSPANRNKAETEYVDKLNELLHYLKRNVSRVISSESQSKFFDRTNELLYCIVTLAKDPHAAGDSVEARQSRLWIFRRVVRLTSEIEDMCKKDKTLADFWKAWKETYTEYGNYMKKMEGYSSFEPRPTSNLSFRVRRKNGVNVPTTFIPINGCTQLVSRALVANGFPGLSRSEWWSPTIQINRRRIRESELGNYPVVLGLYVGRDNLAVHTIVGIRDSNGRLLWIHNSSISQAVYADEQLPMKGNIQYYSLERIRALAYRGKSRNHRK